MKCSEMTYGVKNPRRRIFILKVFRTKTCTLQFSVGITVEIFCKLRDLQRGADIGTSRLPCPCDIPFVNANRSWQRSEEKLSWARVAGGSEFVCSVTPSNFLICNVSVTRSCLRKYAFQTNDVNAALAGVGKFAQHKRLEYRNIVV